MKKSTAKTTKKPVKKAVKAAERTVDADSTKAAAAVLKKFGTQPVIVKKPDTLPKNGIVEINVGPYGTETVAKQEADQFKHKDVFQRRSAIFPLPSSYGVQVEIVEAKVVTAVNKNPLYPYTIALKLKVSGDDEKAKSWITSLRNRVRGIPM